jgi:hypothetical protein
MSITIPVVAAFILFTVALGSQMITLVKSKSAIGVSYQAYLIGAIADGFIIYNSYSFEVQIISAIHLVLALIVMAYTMYLQQKTNYKFKEKLRPFIISFLCSLIMITGVSQAYKSYQAKNKKTNVSFLNYFLQTFNLSIMIFLESNIAVILPLGISLALHAYIARKSY